MTSKELLRVSLTEMNRDPGRVASRRGVWTDFCFRQIALL